jgi:translation initiation factor 2 beta subunit (eIF-2beta)/eIF-5
MQESEGKAMFRRAIEIELQKLEDNNYEQSSRLRIEGGKMQYTIHDFGDDLPYGGDELEIIDSFDEDNTRKFLEILGLTGKSEGEIRTVLQEKFSQRPRDGVFNRAPAIYFPNFIKEHGIESNSFSWP